MSGYFHIPLVENAEPGLRRYGETGCAAFGAAAEGVGEMSHILDADNVRYTKNHEWVMVEDLVATVGITDHAQRELGEVNFIELPSDDVDIHAGDEAATLESDSDTVMVASPVSGELVEMNSALEENPSIVNQDPYGAGWLFRVEMKDMNEWQDLLTSEEYEGYLGK